MEASKPSALADCLISNKATNGTPQSLPFVREFLRRLVTSLGWSGLVFAAAMTDVFLCLSAINVSRRSETLLSSDAVWTGGVLTVYVMDVVFKICAFSLPVYLGKWGNIMDFTVTLLSVLFTSVQAGTVVSSSVAALRYPRILRLVLKITQFSHACRGCKFGMSACMSSVSGARHLAGKDRRRYVNLAYDFDLDLAYIQPRLIGMSVPVRSFLLRLYRNPLPEVVRFFETFHANSYLIVNCCPELPYPGEFFTSGKVVEFNIQDHSPPTLSQVVEFLNLVAEWTQLAEANVTAVHCKGGKGRTGSMCSAWMMYTADAQNDVEASESFAQARTEDFGFQHHKQTVETPSQRRYLEHVSHMLRQQSAFFPARVEEPRRRVLQPRRLLLSHWFRKPFKGGLVVVVQEQQKGGSGPVLYSSEDVHHDAEGSATVALDNAPPVKGDVRVSVFASAKLARAAHCRTSAGGVRAGKQQDPAALQQVVPTVMGEHQQCAVAGKKHESMVADKLHQPVAPAMESVVRGKQGEEPGCLFHFLFHTSFVDKERLVVPLQEMDKACKRKKRKFYYPEGKATLEYGVVE